MPLIILLVFSGSWISGCGTGAEDMECPDTSFSQTNLDTLETNNPKFVFRVCNTSPEYAMEKVEIQKYFQETEPLLLHVVSPCGCSAYFIGPFEGEAPVNLVKYEQGGEEHSKIYLDSWPAVKGLIDSTSIKDTPGRYSYNFIFQKDTSLSVREWSKLEIGREAYY
ncbi:MAG: hypothetical protein WD158_06460 [Balneolaceae bacterium]